jgi:hypothetical protein
MPAPSGAQRSTATASGWSRHPRTGQLAYGTSLGRERVCAEKLLGAAQEFSDDELEDPILRGMNRNDPVARNPCLRRGPLSLDYWTRLPGDLWRGVGRVIGAN